MFYQPSPHYAVETVHQFGPNVIGFQLDTGERRWYIVVCYLATDNNSTIESVVAALKECPQGAKLLVVGDLNVNLAEAEVDQMEKEIAAVMTTTGLEEIQAHLIPRRRQWCRDERKWSVVLSGN